MKDEILYMRKIKPQKKLEDSYFVNHCKRYLTLKCEIQELKTFEPLQKKTLDKKVLLKF